jgi:hypothetical protein
LQEKGFGKTKIITLVDINELLSSKNASNNNCIPIKKVSEPYPNAYSYLDTLSRLL